jgi:hypothetical protein
MQNTYNSNDIIQLLDGQLGLELIHSFKRINYYPNLFGVFNTIGLVYQVNEFTVFVIITAYDDQPKLKLNYPATGIQMNMEINKTLIRAVDYANVHLKNRGRFAEDPL